jgi:glycosyltransferase involved in cell wall biosynthesis
MNVLILSHKPPFPIIDGGCFAMTQFLKNISSIETIKQIEYFSIHTHKHPFITEEFPEIKNVNFSSSFVDTKIYFIDALISFIKFKSYNVSRFYSKSVKKELEKLCQKMNFDIVIFEGLFTTIYQKDIQGFSNAKFGYRAHNIEHEIWQQLAKKERNSIKKFFLKLLAKNLKTKEIELINSVDFILPLSSKDEVNIKKISRNPSFHIPVSIDNQKQKIDFSMVSLCFIGSFNWIPNREGIVWFIKNIFPRIKENYPEININIAGIESEKINELKGLDGVNVKGFVKNSSDFLLENGIFIAPLISGSGVKIKVLEALSLGMPCVLTEIAAEGLDLPTTINISKTADDFTNDLLQLINNESARKIRGLDAYSFIKAEFSYNKINSDLKECLISSTSK